MAKIQDSTSKKVGKQLADIPWYQLAFPAEQEARFRQDGQENRFRRYRLFGAIGIVVFMLYGLVDKYYLPDAYPQTWPWRWLILPALGACSIALSFLPSFQRWYERSTAILNTLFTLALVWFFSLSHMPTAQHYYGGVMLCLVYMMFGLRIPFRLACAGCIVSLAYLGWVLLHWPFPEEADRSLIFILVISCILLGLLGLFQLEKEERRSYSLAMELERDHKQLQQGFRHLQQLSSIDGLSGLFNRRYFDEKLQLLWATRLQKKQDIALLFIDVDYFKNYNDSLGHLMGDEALIQVAMVLKRWADSVNGCAARYGGEEFVLLLDGSAALLIKHLADCIRADVEALSLPHPSSACSRVITVSIGAACAHATINQKSDWLVQTADAAVYQAKKQGRNCTVMLQSCVPLTR